MTKPAFGLVFVVIPKPPPQEVVFYFVKNGSRDSLLIRLNFYLILEIKRRGTTLALFAINAGAI